MTEKDKLGACSFSAENKSLDWLRIEDVAKLKLEPTIRKTQLPTKFSAYLLNEKDLKAFLKSANQEGKSTIASIPIENKCIQFKLSQSRTMSKELAARFPDIISLKGISTSSETVSVRIDYKEDNFKAEINDNGKIYFIDTWSGEGRNYFLIYKKEDAGYEKIPHKSY